MHHEAWLFGRLMRRKFPQTILSDSTEHARMNSGSAFLRLATARTSGEKKSGLSNRRILTKLLSNAIVDEFGSNRNETN